MPMGGVRTEVSDAALKRSEVSRQWVAAERQIRPRPGVVVRVSRPQWLSEGSPPGVTEPFGTVLATVVGQHAFIEHVAQ